MSSASDDFKNKIEIFLQNITSKINDENLIKYVQDEYNALMDICIHYFKNNKI